MNTDFTKTKAYFAIRKAAFKYNTRDKSPEDSMKIVMKMFTAFQNNVQCLPLYTSNPSVTRFINIIYFKLQEFRTRVLVKKDIYTKTNKRNYIAIKFIKFMLNFCKDFYKYFEERDKTVVRDFNILLTEYTNIYISKHRRYNLRNKLNV